MFQEDYVIRLIKQFFQALRRIIGLRESGDLKRAHRALHEAYALFGLESSLCDGLTTESLATMLVNPEKMRAMAELLREDGHLCRLSKDPLRAAAKYRQAFELLLEARAADGGRSGNDDRLLRELAILVPQDCLAQKYQINPGQPG